jgi:hypothetical protein
VRSRVLDAAIDELDAWGERILTAQSIEDVLR